MTLGGFRTRGDKRMRHQTVSEPRSDSGRSEPTALTAYIDQGVEFSGKLRSKGSVRIDGQIKGEVRSGQTVIVGETAMVQAKVAAECVIISGEVHGDIDAKKKITLDKNARVTGNLSTPGIVIEEGARLRGQIVIGAEDEPAAQPDAHSEPPDKTTDTAISRAGTGRRRGARGPALSPPV